MDVIFQFDYIITNNEIVPQRKYIKTISDPKGHVQILKDTTKHITDELNQLDNADLIRIKNILLPKIYGVGYKYAYDQDNHGYDIFKTTQLKNSDGTFVYYSSKQDAEKLASQYGDDGYIYEKGCGENNDVLSLFDTCTGMLENLTEMFVKEQKCPKTIQILNGPWIKIGILENNKHIYDGPFLSIEDATRFHPNYSEIGLSYTFEHSPQEYLYKLLKKLNKTLSSNLLV